MCEKRCIIASGSNILKGVLRGRTIELEELPDLPEGQVVKVTVVPDLAPGEGLRRAFGAWAEDADQLDEFLEQVRRDRQDNRPDPAL